MWNLETEKMWNLETEKKRSATNPRVASGSNVGVVEVLKFLGGAAIRAHAKIFVVRVCTYANAQKTDVQSFRLKVLGEQNSG